jgi:hypothetical protein
LTSDIHYNHIASLSLISNVDDEVSCRRAYVRSNDDKASTHSSQEQHKLEDVVTEIYEAWEKTPACKEDRYNYNHDLYCRHRPCSFFLFFSLPLLTPQQLLINNIRPRRTELYKQQHVNYCLRGLNGLPTGYSSLDASRPWIIFWLVSCVLFCLPTENLCDSPQDASFNRSVWLPEPSIFCFGG